MINKCKNCEHLIERYGYCPVVEDWIRKPINRVSWNHIRSKGREISTLGKTRVKMEKEEKHDARTELLQARQDDADEDDCIKGLIRANLM